MMVPKIKIALVLGMAVNGGTETLWLNYFKHMDKNKFEVDFLVENESKIINREVIEALGGKLIIIPSYKNPLYYMKIMQRIFKKKEYDIVHSNMNTLSLFTLKAAKKAGIKIRISHSHSTSNKKEWKRNILKSILKIFSRKYPTNCFACSELAGKYLFGKNYYESGKVTIINNAIDLNKFSFSSNYRYEIRNEFGIDKNTVLIGNIGRMLPQKNHIFLLKIIKEYIKLNSNVKLMILGDGPLKEKIVKKVVKLGLKNHVILVGTRVDAYKFYSAFDLFCLPSLYEGLPVVGIESQANGCPTLFSASITDEVGLNSNVQFESIDNKTDVWAADINDLIKKSRVENIKMEKYDIIEQTKRLERIYIQVMSDLKNNNKNVY